MVVDEYHCICDRCSLYFNETYDKNKIMFKFFTKLNIDGIDTEGNEINKVFKLCLICYKMLTTKKLAFEIFKGKHGIMTIYTNMTMEDFIIVHSEQFLDEYEELKETCKYLENVGDINRLIYGENSQFGMCVYFFVNNCIINKIKRLDVSRFFMYPEYKQSLRVTDLIFNKLHDKCPKIQRIIQEAHEINERIRIEQGG